MIASKNYLTPIELRHPSVTNSPPMRFRLGSPGVVSIPLLLCALTACARAEGPLNPNNFTAPIKVACVGDSITQGIGASPGHSYPDQLQALLGSKWVIKNYGVSGRTLLRKGDLPWWNEQAFKDAHSLNPDAVVIMLGTNDTRPPNWVHEDEFYGDYKDLIESFKVLPSKPHIWILRPPPIPDNEKKLQVLRSLIDKLAGDENVGEIDVYGALVSKPELFADHVHPNDTGAGILAQTVAHAIGR
jgi:lysophospholipase L1-like esterase